MSKCGICGDEILTGDIHWAIGICNNCYNKLYKSDEQKYIDMLHKETGELLVNSLAEKDQRIAELEQDLEFTTKTANELIEIKHKLEQELAELKEKAILPRFKYKDYVYAIYSDRDIFKGQIDVFDYYTNRYFVFFGEDIGSDWFFDNILFSTEQEAQAKLKEIQGNE